jgi:hypothetical protein
MSSHSSANSISSRSMSSLPQVNLETLQKALHYRFGNHKLLRTALANDEWLAEVGRAAVTTVLGDLGAAKVRECRSDESLKRIASKLSVECNVFCILGAIRLDISHKKSIARLQEVFVGLFDLPSKNGNREFVRFHNVLNNGSSADLEARLKINSELVHTHTKNVGNTALMMVLSRRLFRGVPHRLRVSDWAKLEVLVRYGSDWNVTNSKGHSPASLMYRFHPEDIATAQSDHQLPDKKQTR